MTGGSTLGWEFDGKREVVRQEDAEQFVSVLGLRMGSAENAGPSDAGRSEFGQNLNFDIFGESFRGFDHGLSASNRRLVTGDVGVIEEFSATTVEMQECNQNYWHHKRPKVHSFFQEYVTGTLSDVNMARSSTSGDNVCLNSLSLRNDIFYNIPVIKDGCDLISGDSVSGRNDDGNAPGTLKMNGCEVQMDLNDDLLHLVFSFLDHINLCRAAVVCRQWRIASSHEVFWTSLNFENRTISVHEFGVICGKYPNVSEVNISGPEIHLLVMKAVSSLRNLRTLILGKGQVGDTFFHALSDCCILEKLIVSDSFLGNGMQETFIIHDGMRHLEITKCRVLRISVRCPQLVTLSLKRSNMAHAVLNCPLLRDLDIGSCHKLSDASIRFAAMSCPLLESFDLSNCSCASDETMRDIAISCPNLHILDASYCSNISLDSVRLPMLTVLKLHSCEGITSASMTAISHSYMLEVLELDNCSLLTSVFFELPRLHSIRLVHCRKFTDLKLRCDTLSAITVSNCPLFRCVNITSKSLEKLVLQKQGSLTTVALMCYGLKEVDLTDCDSLTNSICEVFSDGGGCPMLQTLILDNSESLTAVRFCSSSLMRLSLSGCRAITSVEVLCPYLDQISLDGCDHIETASFRPVGLCALNLGICPKLNKLHVEAPQIVVLELKGCGVLSEASINCPLLTSLDASFCCKLKDECLSATSLSCPKIESLILMSCPSIGSDGLYSLQFLQYLSWLDLSYTFLMNLKPVFDSCLQLKVLKLQACKYLSRSSLEPLYKEGALPSLQELDLSYGTLSESVMEELLTCCTHLTHVSLNGCANMHDLNWGFSGTQPLDPPNRMLQSLNCVGCDNITKVLIPYIAKCVHLVSLNISLSLNLKEVNVSCHNLCILNLSNCYSLEILELDCPRLTSLFLQSCHINENSIGAAISQCRMLETLDIRFCPKLCSVTMGMLREVCPSLKRIFSSLPP